MRPSSIPLALLPLLSLCALPGCGSGGRGSADSGIDGTTHRVAAGDVDARSAILWYMPHTTGMVQFELARNETFTPPVLKRSQNVRDARVPAKVSYLGLEPGTRYWYRVDGPNGLSNVGTFRTATAPGTKTGVRFGVGGDWRGELAPYPAVRNAAEKQLDFFVELGDTIYADYASPAVPVPQCLTIEEFRDKHREVYSVRDGLNTLGELRGSTAVFAVIDDHEVIDDFAGAGDPANDPRFQPTTAAFVNDTDLFETGLQAFLEWNPIREERYPASVSDASAAGEVRLYRARQFGDDAALAMIDTRSFRSEMLENPDPLDQAAVDAFREASFAEGRTFLGTAQLDDLKADLLAAQAAGTTWKFVALPEPIQNLAAGNPRDRYEGYARERSELLAFIQDNGILNVVFVAADIHGTIVNNLQFQRTGPNDPQEDVVGAFEITAPAVAYYLPLGPEAINSVSVTPIKLAAYEAMPMDERDELFQLALDDYIVSQGYDATGLEGSTVDATLVEGKWVRVNAYGWCELEVDPATQVLTVTTWGIDYYDEGEASSAADRVPFVLNRFTVTPKPLTAP